MALATQSARLSTVIVRLLTKLSADVGISRENVVLAADETAQYDTFIGQRRLVVTLAGVTPINPNAGGGRVAFPQARVVTVHCCTRNVLDEPGSDEAAICENADLQDAVVNSLLLSTLLDGALVLPPKHVGGDRAVKKTKQNGTFVGTIDIEINYIAAVNSAVEGGSA